MFDPYDRNISAMMEENEWIVPYVTEALATDADSSEWENRLRNSAEGGILGTALEGTIRVIKHFVSTKRHELNYPKMVKYPKIPSTKYKKPKQKFKSSLTLRENQKAFLELTVCLS